MIDEDEFVRIFEGQRLQENRIHHAEQDGVGPDAEREREHGDDGEPRVFQQLAKGESEVVHG